MLKTTNAGALISGASASEGKIKIRMLQATHVKHVGDCEIGDEVDAYISDARFLIGYKFAELVED